MKFLGFFALTCLVAFPQMLVAAGPAEHKYTPRDQIEFAPSTTVAFDRSGSMVTHSTLPDGSLVAEYNGSMGSVTVARVGPDGNIETFCTTDEAAARAWMAGEDTTRSAATFSVPDRVR